jgi:hypothetical protein
MTDAGIDAAKCDGPLARGSLRSSGRAIGLLSHPKESAKKHSEYDVARDVSAESVLVFIVKEFFLLRAPDTWRPLDQPTQNDYAY